MRKAKIERNTKGNTDSFIVGYGRTGHLQRYLWNWISWTDMLQALCVHGGFDIQLSMRGDLEVDCHHSAEDLGIVLGQAFAKALGEKGGIRRYGTACIPMDEALSFCSLDISGRAFLVYEASYENERIGTLDCCMIKEFFRAFAFQAGITLHMKVLYGENDHHKAEALFKAFAHALREAVTETGRGVLSSKGVLE